MSSMQKCSRKSRCCLSLTEQGQLHAYVRDYIAMIQADLPDVLADIVVEYLYEIVHSNYLLGCLNIRKISPMMFSSINGVEKRFYDNGMQYRIAMYNNGKKYGAVSTWSISGDIDSVMMYCHDEQHGESTWYNSNGGVFRTAQYSCGLQHGADTIMWFNGGKRIMKTYVYGRHVATQFWSEYAHRISRQIKY